MRLYLLPILLLLSVAGSAQQPRLKVAFYNVENLYDTINDPSADDGEYTPEGKNRWTSAKYKGKIDRLATVIAQLNADIVGLAEVENGAVVADLAASPRLADKHYAFTHHDSRDRRGIDVAMLYNTHTINLIDWEPVDIKTSRNALKTTVAVTGDTIEIYVLHLPSRIFADNEPRRIEAAKILRREVERSTHKAIVMGDFNDNPDDRSLLTFTNMVNTMQIPYSRGLGSIAYRDRWSMFDNILVSSRMVGSRGGWHLDGEAGYIFHRDFIVHKQGKFKGYPLRTSYKGYSDHLPVFIFLAKDE